MDILDDRLKKLSFYAKDYAWFYWDENVLMFKYTDNIVANSEWSEVEYIELPDQQFIVDGINKKFNIVLPVGNYT